MAPSAREWGKSGVWVALESQRYNPAGTSVCVRLLCCPETRASVAILCTASESSPVAALEPLEPPSAPNDPDKNIIAKYKIVEDNIYNFNKTGFLIGIIASYMVVIISKRRSKAKMV